MTVGLTRNEYNMIDPLERVEQALEEGGWQADRAAPAAVRGGRAG